MGAMINPMPMPMPPMPTQPLPTVPPMQQQTHFPNPGSQPRVSNLPGFHSQVAGMPAHHVHPPNCSPVHEQQPPEPVNPVFRDSQERPRPTQRPTVGADTPLEEASASSCPSLWGDIAHSGYNVQQDAAMEPPPPQPQPVETQELLQAEAIAARLVRAEVFRQQYERYMSHPHPRESQQYSYQSADLRDRFEAVPTARTSADPSQEAGEQAKAPQPVAKEKAKAKAKPATKQPAQSKPKGKGKGQGKGQAKEKPDRTDGPNKKGKTKKAAAAAPEPPKKRGEKAAPPPPLVDSASSSSSSSTSPTSLVDGAGGSNVGQNSPGPDDNTHADVRDSMDPIPLQPKAGYS